MTVWHVGDTIPVTITVDPSDGATAVALALTDPDGTATAPASGSPAAPVGASRTWTIYVVPTKAGRWTLVATVTGVGAGVQPYTYDVTATASIPTAAGMGHANTQDYADLIGGTLPSNLGTLLRRASAQVDRELLSAVYDPADADVLLALRQATCEQAAWLIANGWTDGVVGSGYQSVSIGSVTLSRGSAAGMATGPARFSAEAYLTLQLAGLTGMAPYTGG